MLGAIPNALYIYCVFCVFMSEYRLLGVNLRQGSTVVILRRFLGLARNFFMWLCGHVLLPANLGSLRLAQFPHSVQTSAFVGHID